MEAALKYLDSKPRTVREVELRLDELEFGEQEVNDVVDRLKELNYLNDDEYASNFISSRLACKSLSRRKLREQLYLHKLPKEVIEEALKAVPDDVERDNALLTAKKFYNQFSALDDYTRTTRVAKRLAARGYDYSTISFALGQMNLDVDETMLEGELESDCD